MKDKNKERGVEKIKISPLPLPWMWDPSFQLHSSVKLSYHLQRSFVTFVDLICPVEKNPKPYPSYHVLLLLDSKVYHILLGTSTHVFRSIDCKLLLNLPNSRLFLKIWRVLVKDPLFFKLLDTSSRKHFNECIHIYFIMNKYRYKNTYGTSTSAVVTSTIIKQ